MKRFGILLIGLLLLGSGVSTVFAAGEQEESISVMTSMGGKLLEAFESMSMCGGILSAQSHFVLPVCGNPRRLRASAPPG